MHAITDLPYAFLPQLSEFRIPVYVSTNVSEHARALAQRFERAYICLTNLLWVRRS
ncbi:MAG: hypothetical protein MI924_35140 [Chloroflexales bacterium]|nr:hypothetical protein [Chloroflexales bacterium]